MVTDRKKVWQQKFSNSFIIRFLPLILVVALTVIVAVFKFSKSKEMNVEFIDELHSQNLCSNFCESLLYCGATYLNDYSDVVKINVKSACYTGCIKHPHYLSNCSKFLDNHIAKTKDDCNHLKQCIQISNKSFQQPKK